MVVMLKGKGNEDLDIESLEIDEIENALENLDFTEEMNDLALLEIPEDGDDPGEASEDVQDDDMDEIISEDGED